MEIWDKMLKRFGIPTHQERLEEKREFDALIEEGKELDRQFWHAAWTQDLKEAKENPTADFWRCFSGERPYTPPEKHLYTTHERDEGHER